jgi:folate-binding protein YgfZ
MQPYQHTANFARAGWTGWITRSDRGRLRLTGGDAVEFLQALVTNDVAALKVGGGCDTAYLTPQGRMIAEMHVVRGERDVLLSVPAELSASLAMRLDCLVFTEDVQIEDVSQRVQQITLVGESMSDTKELFFEASRQTEMLAELAAAGIPEISAADADAMRIDAGRARWGSDLSEDTIPLEAGLADRMISQNKGCYVGQEVIVRILHRGGGRVARRLMKIELSGTAGVPATGTPVTIDGNVVGKITSAAHRTRPSRVIALGYIQRDDATEGAVVMVGDHAARLGAAAS